LPSVIAFVFFFCFSFGFVFYAVSIAGDCAQNCHTMSGVKEAGIQRWLLQWTNAPPLSAFSGNRDGDWYDDFFSDSCDFWFTV